MGIIDDIWQDLGTIAFSISMGIIDDIWQDLGKNYNKGFSSPNTSYRSLKRPLKVVTLGSLGKTQDGPSKIGVIRS